MAFKFNMPLDSQLTKEQRMALYETEPLAIQGGPGTGKSVVSLKRHINNIKAGKKSFLVTYTKTLTRFLEQCCISGGEHKASEYISSAFQFRGKVEGEIIIDEAQDLPAEVLSNFKTNSRSVTFGADDRQQLYPEKGSSIEDLKELFPNTENIILEENFRNTYTIMNFVKYLFPKKAIPQEMLDDLKEKNEGDKPILIKHSAKGLNNEIAKEKELFKDLLDDIYNTHSNTAILVPFEKNVDAYYDLVKDMVPNCSKYHNKMNNIGVIENLHVTTFKSSKGLEFDTVIIPGFGSFRYIIDNYSVITEADYFVGLTRAKKTLYLMSNNDIPVPSNTYECF